MKQESTNNDTLLNKYEKKLDKINDEISCIYEIINVFVHNKNNKLNNKFYNYYNNKTIYNKQIAMNALSNLKKHMFNLSNETNILVNKLQRNTFSLIESMTSFIESIQDKLDNDNNNPVRNFYNHVRNIKHMDFIL